MVVGGKIEIRPMMYLPSPTTTGSLTAGKPCRFLVRVKEGVEDPRRLLLEI